MSEGESPKIHIDSDWKAEAQREKERLAQAAQQAAAQKSVEAQAQAGGEAGSAAAGAPGGGKQGAREIPPANFDTLVNMFASQALLYLGAMPDPRSGRPILHLGLARHHIDLLGVIEEKTKGNLTQQQSDTLAATLFELRNQYVSMVTASRSTAQG